MSPLKITFWTALFRGRVDGVGVYVCYVYELRVLWFFVPTTNKQGGTQGGKGKMTHDDCSRQKI